MTLNTNVGRNEYTATSSQTIFNFTFKIYDATDLDVFVTPAGQVCSPGDLTTNYTVLGVDAEGGGSVTLATPATTGDLVTIVSSIPSSRTTDYQNNGDFRPATVNDDIDRVLSIAKQAVDKADRAVTFPDCQQGVTALTMPNPIDSSFLKWKTDLSGLENHTFSATGIQSDVSAETYAALRALTSSAFSDGQVIFVTNDGIAGQFVVKTGTVTDNGGTLIVFTDDSNRYAERPVDDAVNLEWFGAIAGVSTDYSTEIQAAIDYCIANNKTLFIPGNTYRIDAPIVGQTYLNIRGVKGQSKIVKYGNTSSGLSAVDAPERAFNDTMDVDAVLIITHAANKYTSYARIDGIMLESAAANGTPVVYGIYAPRMNLFRITDTQATRCDYSYYTFDSFQGHIDGFLGQTVGISHMKWADDGGGVGSGTSITFTKVWANDCQIGFDLNGLTYSNIISAGVDGATGTASYYLVSCEGISMSGSGFEQMPNTSSYGILISGSDVIINGLDTYNNDPATAMVAAISGSNLILNNCKFTDFVTSSTQQRLEISGTSHVISNATRFPANGSSFISYGTNSTWIDTDDGETLFRKSGELTQIGTSLLVDDALQTDTDATATNTRMLVYDVDNGQLERVSVGAADSGGVGYKVLRILN